MAAKSSFLDKVLGRIGRLDTEGLQTVVQRLARERKFLETLFNTIEDGVLVVDEEGRILYFNQAVTRLLGLQAEASRASPSPSSAGAGLEEDLAQRTATGGGGRAAGVRGALSASAFLAVVRRAAGRGGERAARAWR